MSKKLILADDSITIQKVIGITFANEDYELTVVDNGADALIKAREIKPDLILADVVMPEKDGYQLCQEVKADPVLSGTPVILLTGTFEAFDEARSREVGADDYITKPFESQTLIDKVKSQLAAGAAAPKQAQAAETAPLAQAPEAAAPQTAAAVPPVDKVAEEVVDLGADEIWEMPSREAAPAPPAAQEEAPAPVEEEWSMEEFEEPPAASIGETAVEAEGAAISDEDLWGGMEFGETETAAQEEAEPTAPAAAELAAVPEEASPEEFDEFADFAEFEEGLPEPAQEEEPAPEAPADEEMFGFEEGPFEEEPAAVPEAPVAEEFMFEEEPEPAPAAPPVEEISIPATPAVEEAAVEFMETAGQVLPEPQVETVPPAAPAAREAQAAATALEGISEEQLRAAIAKISREVIEKIVWEVVPELAETMITEEIRKLKS